LKTPRGTVRAVKNFTERPDLVRHLAPVHGVHAGEYRKIKRLLRRAAK
jgi:hypothetical protein